MQNANQQLSLWPGQVPEFLHARNECNSNNAYNETTCLFKYFQLFSSLYRVYKETEQKLFAFDSLTLYALN